MKIGLVTTTINSLNSYQLWLDQDYEDFRIYIAGDKKTPVPSFNSAELVYLAPADQRCWKSSELTGWNTDSRRNFAVLEALKDGADVLLSIDDDMYPLRRDFLYQIRDLFAGTFSGIQVGSSHWWMDHGQMTTARARARGIPFDHPADNQISFVSSVKIGVAQGIIYGVPDSGAVEAIANRPQITLAHEPLASGFVAHPGAYAVFNSQLTAFRRELAPWFVQDYKTEKRNTDIFASLVMRRKLHDLDWYTYYGPPGAWHNRSVRSLVNDLRSEMWGEDRVASFATNIESPRALDSAFVEAWMADVESVL